MQPLTAAPAESAGTDILSVLAGQPAPRPFDATPERPLIVRFCFEEVPIAVLLRRCEGRTLAAITGELGTLPFTAESANQRRRLGMVLAAAQRHSAWRWAVTARQEMCVTTEIELLQPLSPIGILGEIVTALFGIRDCLALLVRTSIAAA
jgi:hypothetical protein